MLRDFTETLYAAEILVASRRRVVARIEATQKGLDTRYVVTNISHCGRSGSMKASIARAVRRRT